MSDSSVKSGVARLLSALRGLKQSPPESIEERDDLMSEIGGGVNTILKSFNEEDRLKIRAISNAMITRAGLEKIKEKKKGVDDDGR